MTRTALALCLALAACDKGPALPDSRLTPGSAASTSTAEICAPGYVRDHRPDALVAHLLKEAAMRNYGKSRASVFYEADHLIPICLGGEALSVANIWPQPWGEASIKDRIEAAACRYVCTQSERVADRELARLQHAFATDWRTVKW